MIIPVVLISAGFFLFTMYLYYKAQKNKPYTGKQALIGSIGIARSDVGKTGKINIHGEIWNAFSDETISAGESVEVISIEGLNMKIKKN
ncbi:MAG: NfeD family protein [Candidatus Marinimicrobia bacterium]|nr:NfeD family protein [Candidatus Neomarinimicrobiota bacterium]